MSQDESIVIKKADKSNTIVIMNIDDYRKEVLRQLDDVTYYETLSDDPTHIIKKKISECIETLSKKNSNITKEFDTFPTDIRTPIFYVLPKIHKEANENLPIRYPRRPIVSACNSATENISKFLDSILHPYVTSLSSYIKDTTDFIKKVKNIKFCSKDCYLVTLDVSSLYANIPHEDGIQACKSFLEKDGTSTEGKNYRN